MQTNSIKTDILIVGAGMAGLCAATDLQQSGYDVLVIDKGRGLGGRMASRRIGSHTFDHGAQFITARSERFTTLIHECVKAGTAKEWYRTKGGKTTTDTLGHPRWCGQPSITAIAKHIAAPLTIRRQTRLSTIHQDDDNWIATLENGDNIQANAVIMTPPVPQILDLLTTSQFVLPQNIKTQLEGITYERCIAVMAVLDKAIDMIQPGTLDPNHKDIALIVDNQRKGISKAPALTIHATPEFSLEHWSDEREAAGKQLLDATESYLNNLEIMTHSQVIDYQTHGWLYSKPHKVAEASHVVVNDTPPLLVAGDAFGASLTGSYVEARVEGAALSGWAAAEALTTITEKKFI